MGGTKVPQDAPLDLETRINYLHAFSALVFAYNPSAFQGSVLSSFKSPVEVV